MKRFLGSAAFFVLAALAVPVLSFAQAPTFNTLVTTYKGDPSFAHPGGAAVGDFNGDGKLDSAVFDGTSTIHILLGNGDGTFAEHRADVPQITASTAVGLNASFAPYLPQSIDGVVRAIKAVDVNGDGKLDIVALFVVHLNFAPLGGTTVLINAGNDASNVPQFTTATHYFSSNFDVRSLTIGDPNGDGKPDFIIGNAFGALQVYLNNGGTFTAGQTMSLQPGAGGPAVGPGGIADVNGDGKADYIVTSNQNGGANIFLGNGNGTFQAPTFVANTPNAVSIVVADLNKDGKQDFVVGNTDATVGVFLNNGGALFTSAVYSTGGSPGWNGYTPIAVADMNGDGRLDVVVGNSANDNVGVLLGNGSGAFAASTLFAVNHLPLDIAVADFNHDAKPDVAAVGYNDDTYGVLTNTTVFPPPPPPPVQWVDWRDTVTENGVLKYRGYLNVTRPDGSVSTVTVKYSGPRGIAFYQTGRAGETDFWQQQTVYGQFGPWKRDPATSPYTSSAVTTIPTGTDIIALQYKQKNTLEFTDAANNPLAIASPVFAYVSLNGNGYGFDQDFDILSYDNRSIGKDAGFWGIGTSFKSVTTVNGAPQYQLLGTGEPHGTLQFRGSFSTVNWDSLSDENWNGFTIGVAQLAADIPIANAGADQTVTANSANGATVQLSGSVTGSTKTPFTFAWSGDFGTATGQNPIVSLSVGTHTITLKATDAANASDTDTVVITVLPNPAPVITSPTTASVTYGSSFSYTITATNSPDTFGATGLPAGLTLSGAVISGTPAVTGTFDVKLSAQNSGGTGAGSLSLTITKANASVVIAPYNVTYDGQPHSATVTSITGVNGETGATVGSVTLNTTHTDAGTYSDTWSFTGGANYNNIAAITITDIIAKANASLTVNGYTGTYDGAAHGATGSATGVGGVNLHAGLSLGASFTNVPGGSASWSFSGGANYNDATGTAAIVINKANATVAVSPYNVEYDVQPHSATVTSITGVNGETGATVGSVTLNTTHTNVGIYSDSWSFTGAPNYNNIAATTITDTIKDTTPPVITSVSPSQATLWPPNHQMVAITVNAAATDLVGVTSLKIISVTSSEPDNGLGDGDTPGDIVITGALSVSLRAERGGSGNGRIYTITVEARDAAGNATTKVVTVTVPKSQSK